MKRNRVTAQKMDFSVVALKRDRVTTSFRKNPNLLAKNRPLQRIAGQKADEMDPPVSRFCVQILLILTRKSALTFSPAPVLTFTMLSIVTKAGPPKVAGANKMQSKAESKEKSGGKAEREDSIS